MTALELRSFCQFLVQQRLLAEAHLVPALRLYSQDRVVLAADTAGAALHVINDMRAKGVLAATNEPVEAVVQRWLSTQSGSGQSTIAGPPDEIVARQAQPRPSARQPRNPTPPPDYPPKIGPYLIKRKLGEGGMGAVFQGVHEELGITAAIKIIKDGLADDETVERFRREAIVLLRISHPNFARGYGVSNRGESPRWLAMEFIPGDNLDEAMAKMPKEDIDSRLKLFADVCRGTNAMHQLNLVHRDLKPANVRVSTEGRAVVMDPGMVKHRTGQDVQPSSQPGQAPVSPELTGKGVVMGTVVYMSPEQAAPMIDGGVANLTPASDVYTLGKIIYFLLTGEHVHPFKNCLPAEIVQAIAVTPKVPTKVYAHLNQLPADEDRRKRIIAIIEKCLQPRPEMRYQNAGEIASAIDAYFAWLKQREAEAREAEAKRFREQAEALEEAKHQEAEARRKEAEAVEAERQAKEARKRDLIKAIIVGSSVALVLMVVAIFALVARKAEREARQAAEARTQAETRAKAAAELAAETARVAEAAQRRRSEATARFLVAQSYMKACRWAEAETELLATIAQVDSSFEPARYALAQVQFNLDKEDCVQQWQWLVQNGAAERRSEYAFYAVFHQEQFRLQTGLETHRAMLDQIADQRYRRILECYFGIAGAVASGRRNDQLDRISAAEARLPRREESGDLVWLADALRGFAALKAAEYSPAAERAAKLWQARQALEASAARNPDFPMTYQWLGEVLRQTGDYAGAAAAYLRMGSLYPKQPTAQYQRMDCLILLAQASGNQDRLLEAAAEAVRVCERILTQPMRPRQRVLARTVLFKAYGARTAVYRERGSTAELQQAQRDVFDTASALVRDDALLPEEWVLFQQERLIYSSVRQDLGDPLQIADESISGCDRVVRDERTTDVTSVQANLLRIKGYLVKNQVLSARRQVTEANQAFVEARSLADQLLNHQAIRAKPELLSQPDRAFLRQILDAPVRRK